MLRPFNEEVVMEVCESEVKESRYDSKLSLNSSMMSLSSKSEEVNATQQPPH